MHFLISFLFLFYFFHSQLSGLTLYLYFLSLRDDRRLQEIFNSADIKVQVFL